MDTIYFYLPDFFDKFELNIVMCELMEQCPEYFYDHIKIGAVYGCFPNAIWNGGRVVLGGAAKEDIDSVIEAFNSKGVPIRYTFTNTLLEEKHLYDTFCNLCLKEAHNGMNEVIINSPLLEAYIRSHYPKYKFISSTTKCLNTVEGVKEELKKDYRLIVLDNSFNNQPQVFELPEKERFEIIVNSYCRDNCPNRVAHYKEISRAQLEFRDTQFAPCPYIKLPRQQQMKKHGFIKKEQVYGAYKEAGFRHFKLDGRAFSVEEVLENYLYYMVKPVHQEAARKDLIKMMSSISYA